MADYVVQNAPALVDDTIDKVQNLTGETGESETVIMHQKGVTDNLALKVDKVTGKGLSTEDYTTAEKTKLSEIEAEANKTVIVQETGTSTTDVMSQDAATTAINGKVEDSITDGHTTVAPSGNAVFDALALKQDELVMSNIIYVDGDIGDDSNTGTVASPVKTLHGAIILANTLTTATGFEIHIAQGTYTETSDVTLPNLPIIVYGNNAIISASGYTITIPNPYFVRYNLFTTSNVVYDNFATGARCIIQGGGITGNVTVNSYVEMTMCQLNSGTITVGSTGQLLVTYCSPTSVFTSAGVLVLNKANMNTGKSSYLITSTAGQLTVTECILSNLSTGGAIHCENGATSALPNMIANNFIAVASGNTVLAGTAYTIYSKNHVVGTAPSGTNLVGVNTDILGAGTIPQLGSDATGDTYYRNSSGLLAKLGVGASGTLLNSSGTLPQWSSASTLGLPTLSGDNVYTGTNSGILKSYTATLPYTSWTGSSAPYTKAVTVAGILSTDKPDIDLDLSSTTYSDVATIQSDWANVYRGVTSADTITFYASTVPTIDVPLSIKVVR